MTESVELMLRHLSAAQLAAACACYHLWEGPCGVHLWLICAVAALLVLQDYKTLSNNVAVRSSGSSTARDAAAAQEALTDYMNVRSKLQGLLPTGKDMCSTLSRCTSTASDNHCLNSMAPDT